MAELEVYVPVAQSRVTELPLAPRVGELGQAKIGLLDNQKANAGELLMATAEQLRSEHPCIELDSKSKNATAPASDDLMAHLKTCDAVVLAIAD